MSKRPSYRCRESGKLSFVCPVTYGRSILLRLTAPSAEGWAVGEALSAASQGLTPLPVCHVQGGGQRLGRQVFPSQPRGHWPFWCQMTTSILHLARPSIRGPILSENPASPRKTPPASFTSGRLLWLYDYIWGFVWLCMYLHHSQLVPINNRARV